jgi:hypothetical protein
MNLAAKPLQNPAVLARKIADGEMVLVNADNATSLALTNQPAVLIWEMTDGRNSVQDIIAGVTSHFQDVPDSVSSDVLVLLDMLARDGFIGFEWDRRP